MRAITTILMLMLQRLAIIGRIQMMRIFIVHTRNKKVIAKNNKPDACIIIHKNGRHN